MTTPPRGITPRPKPRIQPARPHPRVGVDFPVAVYSADLAGPLAGRARDLSVTGVCVATPSPFAFKSTSRVVLTLPTGPIALEAEGLWQHEVASDDIVLTGLAFREPDRECVEQLWDVILERGKQLTRFLYAGSDLCDLTLEDGMGLAQVTRIRDLAVGNYVYRQDGADVNEDAIWILAQGHIVLQFRVRDVREVPFARLGPGSLLGGLPLTAGTPHAESAVADSAIRLLEIDRNAYQFLLTAKPWLALRLAQSVSRVQSQRVRELAARLRDKL